MTGRVVWIERNVEPRTFNALKGSRSYHARSRELADWRSWAKEAASSHDPIVGPVAVSIVHLRLKHNVIDCGAPYVAAKGALDGIVDAGVLPDDSTRYVWSLTFDRPEVTGYHGLRIIVRPIELHHPRAAPSSGPLALLAQQDPGDRP